MVSVLLQMTSLLGEQSVGVTAISETLSSSSVLVKRHALIHLQRLQIGLLHNCVILLLQP